MKRLALLAAVVVAVSVVAPSSASALIQIDRGIAGARLGNTKAQVRAALGQPRRVVNGRNEFGPFTQFRYAGGIIVTFQSGNTVTAVQTTGLGDRTARGVGVRSTGRAVRRRVPGLRCTASGNLRICETGTGLPGQRVTAFFIRSGRVFRVTVAFVID
ncbi:MAG: hypothetical protein ICV69_04895 [Thermoleophilaceae bacterium]|nr:hypothetical protein [Thermoleophilaceae bacterium]